MKWRVTAALLLRRWGQDKRGETSKKIMLAAGIAAITAVDLSHAATIAVKTSDNGSSIVYVTGTFQPDDDKRFESATASLSRAFVTFDSPGGSAVAGMLIGAVIHAKGFTTYVGSGAVCASACGVAWISGSRRAASINGRIGFHAMYISSGSETRETGSGNAVLGAYLTEIGLSIKAIAYMTNKGPDSMQWLSFPEAREVGIEVEQQEWNVSAATASRPSQLPTYSPAPAVAADRPPQTFAPPAPAYNEPEPDYESGYAPGYAPGYGPGYAPGYGPGYGPAYAPYAPYGAPSAPPPVYAPRPPVVYGPAPVYRAPVWNMPRAPMMPRYAAPAFRYPAYRGGGGYRGGFRR